MARKEVKNEEKSLPEDSEVVEEFDDEELFDGLSAIEP